MRPNSNTRTGSATVTLLHEHPNLSIFHKPAGMPVSGNKPRTLLSSLNLADPPPNILSVPRPLSGPAIISKTSVPAATFTFFAIVHALQHCPSIPGLSISHQHSVRSTSGALSVLLITSPAPGQGLKKRLFQAGIPAVGTTKDTIPTSCATRAVYIACTRLQIPSLGIDVRIPPPPNFSSLLEREQRFARTRAARVQKRLLVADSECLARFMKRTFYTRGTMAPRESTETVARAAVRWMGGLEGAPRVLDLGTGCGAILISALLECGRGTGVGVDNCLMAVNTARRNAREYGLGDVKILHADFGNLGDIGVFDVVVSNPPYLTGREIGKDRCLFENDPESALLAGRDGLDAYRSIAKNVGSVLIPGGALVIEIGASRDPAVVRALFEDVGLVFVDLIKDFRGFNRCLVLRSAG